MARFTINFMSEAVKRAIALEVVLPADHAVMPAGELPPTGEPYKTLYYLEGSMGNASGPLNYSQLQLMAEDYDLAVVVIGGENRWWGSAKKLDEDYGAMVTTDVVNFTRRVFNLSRRREDTFIGGFSMGGHGAFVLGLRNPELFGRIISLDASLQKMAIQTSVNEKERWDPTPRTGYETIFGLEKVEDWIGSRDDYEFLAKELAENVPESKPEIFMSCGTKDGLYAFNRDYEKLLLDLGYAVTWNDVEGAMHSYYSCNAGLDAAMKWLPLHRELHTNYPYYGIEANVGFENFNGWKPLYNVEAAVK